MSMCVWLAACYQFRELTVHWWKIWVKLRAELDAVVVIFSFSFWLFLSEKRMSSALEGRLRSGRANCLHLEERSDSTTKDDDNDDARLPIVASQTDGQTRLAGTVYLFFWEFFLLLLFPPRKALAICLCTRSVFEYYTKYYFKQLTLGCLSVLVFVAVLQFPHTHTQTLGLDTLATCLLLLWSATENVLTKRATVCGTSVLLLLLQP